MTGSALYCGKIVHQRLWPRRHRLRYRIFSLLLDLDELPALSRRLRLFAHNRFGLFAFHDRDYLDGSGAPLGPGVRRLVGDAIGHEIGRVRLLTMPRILGFAFNPVSLYFCDGADGRLRAILYEVNNTFGQRHSYLIPVETPKEIIRQTCDKAFHVSPFMAMDMRYQFTVRPPADRLDVTIAGSDSRGTLIVATHHAVRRRLNDLELARAFVAYPLLTVKVVGGILWEAGKLWIKRVPVHARPSAPDHPVSIVPPPPANDLVREKEPACI